MPNASIATITRNEAAGSGKPQPAANWLLRRVIDELAAKGEFRWGMILADYERRLAMCVRAA